ncbi:hypothetical protein IU444_28860 [Nocardia farcinica]|uniref:hypothetical protein n=1 Tax=Nocardia farcinica TaxID=37329 RepID=UPI0018942C8F|nr:hypothetical protein [Nocardia farcinica]MBF6388142.1 hypothetical protein [Nocardia farcinica]UEX26360.1 hypothetical protein LMJ57_30900 [Nocardia farcinica]
MSTTQTVETRTAQLDPEIRRRGLWGLSKLMVIVWSVAVALAILLWLSLRGWPGAAAGGGLLAALALSTIELGDQKSYAQRAIFRWRNYWRRRRGEHIYYSAADRGDFTGRPSPRYNPDADPAWVHPVPLGRVEPLPLDGTGFDSLFILRHSNPGETEYLSVVLQVEGLKGGLRSNAAYAASWQSYGFLEAELAKSGSFIRGIQQVHRSVSYDLTPHIEWYSDQLVNRDGRLEPMVTSYWGTLEEIRPLAEEHRVWYVVKIPVDDRFISEARGRDAWGDGRRAEVGWASVVKDELERFQSLLHGAGMGEVTVLGERRTCAVIRALMDPSFALDDDRDVDWETCWQSYWGERDAVVVNDRWHTRVAHIAPGAIEPTPLGPLWLHPLLVGVEADEGSEDQERSATIRTVSVRMDFTPDYIAREQAVKDLTMDAADDVKERKKGRIDDGTGEVMMSSSKRRRRDLRPGSNIHGMSWSMWVSVTGRDADDLRRACIRVSNAAGKSAIKKLDWQDDVHDVTQIATLPLARGMAGSKESRTA